MSASMPSGAALVYGILGHPVTQSLSPAMHNAAFRALGLDAVYVPFPVAPARLEAAQAFDEAIMKLFIVDAFTDPIWPMSEAVVY